MPRSVAEIEADIARVKQEIAARNTYKQPKTRVGWGSYIVEGDRGMLDAYQNRENQWKNQMQQQGYQAAQAALNRKFQEEQNNLNRDLQLEIAKMNKETANEDKREEARLQMQRLILQRSKMQEQGMNTGDLDLQIKHLADKYDFETAPEAKYDITKDPEYILAKYENLDYMDDIGEGSHILEDARKDLMNFRTPAAVKRVAKIDEEIKKRDKYRENQKAVKAAINQYWSTGEMPDLLIQLGFEEDGTSNNRFLRSGKRIYRRPGKNPAKPATGPVNN